MTQMVKKWRRFHEDNPEVYALFKKFSFELISVGFRSYSAKSVFERIQWHTDVQTRRSKFKLNNNYTAYYARLFHVDHPHHNEFFETRNTSRQEMDDE